MRPTPAERRHIVRHAVECAIGLHATTRPGQAAPLTEAAWRVVEPALVQRDRQIAAVRDVLADMEGVTGDRAWADALRGALDVKQQPATTAADVAPRAVVQGVTRQQLHEAIRTLARTDRAWWNRELGRMNRTYGQRIG